MLSLRLYALETNLSLFPKRNVLILSYKIEDKIFLAECSPLPGYNQESLQDVLSQIQDILPSLTSIKTLENFNRWDKSYTLYPSLQFALNSLFLQITSPIEDALSIPIRRFINIPYENSTSKAKLLEKLSSLTGSACIKIKLGSYPLEETISLMKSALSITKAQLILDFNQSYSLEKMKQFCDHFDPCSFKTLEDPLQNPLDLFTLATTHSHSIALEQSLRTHGIKPFLSLPTLKTCEFKPTIDMPLLRGDKLFKTLSHHNIDIAFSSAYETKIGLTCIAHLAHQNSLFSHHGLDTLDIFKESFHAKTSLSYRPSCTFTS